MGSTYFLTHQGTQFGGSIFDSSMGKEDPDFKDIRISKSYKLQAGLGYQYFTSNSQDLEQHQLQLNVAKSLFSWLSLGLSVKTLWGELNSQSDQSWDSQIGVLFLLRKNLILGLSVDQIFESSFFQTFQKNEPLRHYSLGLSYEFIPNFEFKTEISSFESQESFKRPELKVGFENQLNSFFALRFGYANRLLSASQSVHAGLSFTGPKLQVHLGTRLNITQMRWLHGIDLNLGLW